MSTPMDYAEDWLLARAALRRFEEHATHEDWLHAAMDLDTLAHHIEQLALYVQSKGVTVAQPRSITMATLESLAAEVADLKGMLAELLSRVRGPTVIAPPEPNGPDSLPDPVPGEGIVGYAMRCADFVGGEKGAQAKRAAGSLFLVGQTMVNKHNGKWKPAIWEFIMGDPAYKPDPAWGSYRPGGSV